ncbi:hypothetical protein CMI37_02915 [Candidatus Pacearchaeota archaeon]|nr:hypothetical protein [Candidatus Pacearchaeota archaeon]|tara:strand:- start:972 stop:1613 length:642 start_codon:yes stop_codon:yes gene_type:complete
MIGIIKKSLILLAMVLFSTTLVAQEPQSKEQVRLTVQLKMIQAHNLYSQGKVEQAKLLVKDSIDIMLFAMRNGQAQPWMREGIKIAMQSNKTPEIEMKRIMLEVERYIPKERELSLREKLNSLEDTPATRELARDRKALMFNRTPTLGQRGVGYHPIISILPQGASLSVSPIVSADRRYVRITTPNTPIMMGVGKVHTFNFSTGSAQSFNERR